MNNYLIVCALAAAWWAWANRLALSTYIRLPIRADAPTGAASTAWQERWVATLLRLQKDLETAGKQDAAALTRELVWRILGGQPHNS